MKIRRFIYKQLHQRPFERGGLSASNWIIFAAICLSVLLVIVETERPFYFRNRQTFALIDYAFGAFFAIEYVLRVWSVGVRKRYRGLRGRLKYMLQPTALIDLLVVVPFFLISNSNVFLARIIRLVRILTVIKIGRYSQSFGLVREAIWSRRHELMLSAMTTCLVLLLASTVMWIIEPDPEFSSIPRALWWGVVTLTTVGYGDVYPQTVLGKICSGITALCGVGLIAMPAGILAAAFGEAISKQKNTIEHHKIISVQRLERVRRIKERGEKNEAESAESELEESSRAYYEAMRLEQEAARMRRETAKMQLETARMHRDALKLQRDSQKIKISSGEIQADFAPHAVQIAGQEIFNHQSTQAAHVDHGGPNLQWACEKCGHDRFIPILAAPAVPSSELAVPPQTNSAGSPAL